MEIMEKHHEFQLWHGVIVVSVGLFVISLIFVGIMVFFKKCWSKNSIRYVYQTKPMKSEWLINCSYYNYIAEKYSSYRALNDDCKTSSFLFVSREEWNTWQCIQCQKSGDTGVSSDKGQLSVHACFVNHEIHALKNTVYQPCMIYV